MFSNFPKVPSTIEANRTAAREILGLYSDIGHSEGWWQAMSQLVADEFLDCGCNAWANTAQMLGMPVYR